MANLSERDITTKIVTALNGLENCRVRKIHSGGVFQSSWPDIIGCINGRALFIEVKRPETRDKLTKGQNIELKAWARTGAVTGVVTSVDEAIELVRRCER